jgi:hypothetical protein
MDFQAVALIAGGVVAVVWGLPAMHRLRAPFDILASLTVLLGVALALLGVLIFTVPGFFKG